MRVLFVSATDPISEIENRVKPLWPAFLSAYVKETLGNDFAQFRYGAGPVRSLIQQHKPDLLAISSVTQNFGYAEQFAREASEMNVPVIVGGMHISCLPNSLAKEMAVGCIGEGEQTFAEILSVYKEHGGFPPSAMKKIKGVVFHNNEGSLTITDQREKRPQVNDLPHPDRSLTGYGQRAYVYTARGCQYKCVFCSCHRFWGEIRYATPEYILQELEELIAHGTRVVRFADENFVGNLPRLRNIVEAIERRGINKRLKFSCWCRANNVTQEVVSLLKRANIVSVKLGLESGSERVLRFLKGPSASVDRNMAAVRMLKKAGLQVNADFLFGAPDETMEEILETYSFVKKAPIDFFDIDIFSPLPATPVWDMAKEKGLVSETSMDWSRLNYKFVTDPRRAIVLSNILTHSQLLKVHKKFQRLRFIKSLCAVPRSPWLKEIPGAALRKIRQKLVRTAKGKPAIASVS